MSMARQDGNTSQNGSGGASAARSDLNDAFALTSFLYGGNAAYAEQLYERYVRDPSSVDAEWRDFFAGLKEDRATVEKSARGPSWKAPNGTRVVRDEFVAALDGDWDAVETALRTKLKAADQ